MTSKTILVLVITAAFVAGTLTTGTFASAQTAQSNVPDWVKNNAVWWADGSISENDFLKGIQWLINEEIIQVATAEQVVSQTEFQSMVDRLNGLEQNQNEIADMIKQNAGASDAQIAALQAELENRIALLKAKVSGEIAADCTVRGPAVDLHGCDLSNADLSLANLSNADLSLANLSNADLSLANLSNADLRVANLQEADLRGANLRSAILDDADLSNADLTGADLTGADLTGAYLGRANMDGANLTGTDLYAANLSLANMDGANFNGSNLIDADFTNCVGTPIGTPAVGTLPTCS